MRKMAAAGAHGSRRRQLHLHDVEDDVDAFSGKELARRPEVRLINSYAAVRAYVVLGMKGIGALLLLWATVVLLGGFVSSLKKKDFWYISIIAFVHAAGMLNAVFDNQLKHLKDYAEKHLLSARTVKYNRVDKLPDHGWSWLMKRIIRAIISKSTALIVIVVIFPVLTFCAGGPYFCALLSTFRIRQKDYGSSYRDSSSEANLKRGIDFFYFLCIGYGLLSMLVLGLVETIGTQVVVMIVSKELGLCTKLVLDYCMETRLKYLNNLASTDENWNLITYGAGLLDSEMPEDTASGGRVLTTLIEHGVPVRRLLLRSPRHRIQKLIGILPWTSPAEWKMRCLAAKIVEHVALGLSLAQFPGALECIASLLDTSGYDRGGDLILKGLRILENLSLDQHNCKVICSSDALVSKIVAPVSSENLIQDMRTNAAWAKVADGSLKLVSQLIRSPSETGKEMCHRVADNSRAVKNLEEILVLEINTCNIIELQIRAIEILEQICLAEPDNRNWDRERTSKNLSTKVLHIFLTDKWMDDYLSKTREKLDEEIASQHGKINKSKESQHADRALVENKMKAAEDAVRQLKEKAGEALATLCMENLINSDDIISSNPGCCADVVRYLTEEMLNSEERTIRCRYSAAVILKHLCTHCTTLDHGYLKETTLTKVLRKVLHINTEAEATSTSRSITSQGHEERVPVRTAYKQQYEERTLQVALLSLCAAMIRGRFITAPDFASVVALLVSPNDLAEKLKRMVEESRYATVSCLATVKLSCEIVMAALIPHDHLDINMKKEIMDSLCQASETMAGLESCMLFAGADRDCYGLPVKPFCSDLVKQAQELLREKEQEMGLPNV